MSTYRSFIDWVNHHQEVVLDIIRIYLGVGLFVRGVLFIATADGVNALVDLGDFSFASAAIAAYVTFAHLFGGLLLAAGLLTRIVALIQIPILAGAVFLIHLQDGLLSANQSLEFSALVLFLLGVVFVFGGGPWSADHYVFADGADEEDELEAWWRPDASELGDGTGRTPVAPSVRGASVDAEPVDADDVDLPVAGASGGPAVAPAPAVGTLPRRAVEVAGATKECACGNDVNHPRVSIEPRYSWTAGFYFMLGISAPVKEVVFYCEECGTIMKRSRDPEVLERYRWHTS